MMDTSYMTGREIRIALNKKRRIRIVRRQRIALAFFLAGILMLILFFIFTIKLEAHNEKPYYKYYTAIDVHPGDTLTGISKDYVCLSHYRDISDYLEEVKSINHLDDDYTITGDKKLILPYYSYEFK